MFRSSPELNVDEMRLRPVRLPVRLQVIVSELIHSKTWTQPHISTRLKPEYTSLTAAEQKQVMRLWSDHVSLAGQV